MKKIQNYFSFFFLIVLLILCFLVCRSYAERTQPLTIDFTTADLMKYSDHSSGTEFSGTELRIWLFAEERPDLGEAFRKLDQDIHGIPGMIWLTGSDRQQGFIAALKKLNYYRSVAGNTEKGFSERLKELQASGIGTEEMNRIMAEDPLLLDYAFPVSSFFLNPEGRLIFKSNHSSLCDADLCTLYYGELSQTSDLEAVEHTAQELKRVKSEYEKAGGHITVFNPVQKRHDFFRVAEKTLLYAFLAVLAASGAALFFLYRSVRPFAEMLLVLTFSYGISIMAVWGFLGHLHVMTLFFSLAFWIPGIDIYLNFNNARESGRLRRNHIAGVWVSMLVTVVIYGAMAQIGFRIFSELAVIALFFISLFCILYGGLVFLPPVAYRGRYGFYRRIRGIRRFVSVRVLAMLLVFGIAAVSLYGLTTAADGIIFNYAREGAADKMARIASGGRDLTVYSVTAGSDEILDSRLSRLREWLDRELLEKRIGYYILPFDMVISENVAQLNMERNRELYVKTDSLREQAGLAGTLPEIPEEELRSLISAFAADPALRLFFPESSGSKKASLVVFREKPGFYNSLRNEFAWVESDDQVSSYVRGIAPQSADIIILISLVFAVMAAVIYAVKGVSSFIGMTLPVFAGLGFSALVMTFFSSGLSLFSILIILLVSGITFDFAVFSRRAGRHRDRRAGITFIVSVLISESMFALFLCSGVPVFRMTGAVMVSGITAGAVTALLLNMFILFSGRGRLRSVSAGKKAPEPKDPPPEAGSPA